MRKSAWKKIWKWFQVVVLVYFPLGVMFYFFQDKIIFHPKKLPSDYQFNFNIPFRELNVPVSTKRNVSIVQFTVPDSVRKGIVLYFHGNRENINRYAKFAGQFTRNGYEAWMIDYPGYGKTTGKRSEQTLYADALLMYKLALDRIPVEKIIIYGKSLGSGIAAQLASIRDCKRLILETPYYSMQKLAAHYFFIYPVFALVKFELPTYKYLQDVKVPIEIIHGTRDGVIPFKHALRLSAIKPGIELTRIEKGRHNDLAEFPLFQQKIDSLLKN